MKRRYFLTSALAAVCGAAAWRYARSSDEAAIAEVLHKKLDYLRLDGMGVRRFAADLAARHSISSNRLRILDAAGPLYSRSALSGDNWLDNAIRHGEDRVVTFYLLSSDFFKHHADENRVVQYTGFYDPLIACGDPFARPVQITTGV